MWKLKRHIFTDNRKIQTCKQWVGKWFDVLGGTHVETNKGVRIPAWKTKTERAISEQKQKTRKLNIGNLVKAPTPPWELNKEKT